MESEYSIPAETVVPLRAEASETSEMVSQLLFGEPFRILETAPRWLRIETAADRYVGWIDRKMALDGTVPETGNDSSGVWRVRVPLAEAVCETTQESFRLPMGSCLPAYDPVTGRFRYGPDGYSLCFPADAGQSRFAGGSALAEQGRLLLNAPYLWGGRTLLGVDCSGLVQLLFLLAGIRLPRDASRQAEAAPAVADPRGEPGDLLFFRNEAGRIVHVGVQESPDRVLHASGRVRIDRIDERGIYRTDERRYTHVFDRRIPLAALLSAERPAL